MIDYVKQAEQEQQEKVNRLYPKKWRKFEKPISVLAGTHVPPVGNYNTEYYWLILIVNSDNRNLQVIMLLSVCDLN